jgi:DNA-directed RNA polymerase specialized sigma24 family protein
MTYAPFRPHRDCGIFFVPLMPPAREVSSVKEIGPDDAEVGIRLRHGDQQALAWAYERWGPQVHGLACRALGPGPAADAVTRDVFVSAWRGRVDYRPGVGLPADWLTGLTRHRLAHLHQPTITPGAQPGTPTVARDTQTDRRLAVLAELERVSEPARSIMEMALLHNLTHQQIADNTSLPPDTVRSHIGRTLTRLDRAMKAVDPPP